MNGTFKYVSIDDGIILAIDLSGLLYYLNNATNFILANSAYITITRDPYICLECFTGGTYNVTSGNATSIALPLTNIKQVEVPQF
jgi:hypothetical protein